MNYQQLTPSISVGVDEAARLIGVARSMLYELIARGEIDSFKIGRRRLILMSNLMLFVQRQAEFNSK